MLILQRMQIKVKRRQTEDTCIACIYLCEWIAADLSTAFINAVQCITAVEYKTQ